MNQITTIPATDSIKEIEQFWDTHDLTDYEDQLEEIADTVFESKNTIRIDLGVDDAETIKKIALKKGIPYQILVREWVLDKVRTA